MDCPYINWFTSSEAGAYSSWFLEVQAKLALQHAVSGFHCHLTPRNRGAEGQIRINRQIRVVGLRMIQYVKRVDAKLKASCFREPEGLGEIRIETPNRQPAENHLAQIPSMSRKRILQNDQPVFAASIVERNRAG